jgi:signal peptidase I
MDSTTIFYLVVLASFAGLYKIFERAGEKGWKALVPFYNFYVWLNLLKRPKWWLVFFFIPGVNALMYAILMFQTAYAFGKRKFMDLFLASFLCFFYALYLGFAAKDAKWKGPDDFHNLQKGFIKSWLDPIFFAIVAASIIRTFFLEAFTIPTSSLEKSLLVGDFLFVNKLSYGSRVPMTPLAFPLAHHTIPVLNTKAYLEFWKLPYMRLPGYKKIKNGDIVVFNYPDGDSVALNWQDRSYYNQCRQIGSQIGKDENNSPFTTNDLKDYNVRVRMMAIGKTWIEQNSDETGKVIGRPVDKREHYVKRCVAIAGDKLEVKNGVLYINDQIFYHPEHLQHFYYVVCSPGTFSLQWLDENNVNLDETFVLGPKELTADSTLVTRLLTHETYELVDPRDRMELAVPEVKKYYKELIDKKLELIRINFEDDRINELKQLPGVTEVVIKNDSKNKWELDIFPHSPKYPWNNDNFGPLVIPKAGTTVKIDTGNICLYDRIIDVYEGNDFKVENGKVYINGQVATEYTFKQDYYWMMGDNRHNSADSRSWGYVPFDHVVGTPVFVWFSLKYDDKQPISGKWSFKNIFASEQNGKLRWSRFFCFVSDKGLSKSYFIYFLVIAGGWYGVSKFLKFRRKKKGELPPEAKK